MVFNDKRCADCGIIGDPRIMPKFCHMEKTIRHVKMETVWGHPEPPVWEHSGELLNAHIGELVREPWYKALTTLQVFSPPPKTCPRNTK